jgi:hypothetical protein
VFWTENADSKQSPSLQVVATSTDGGSTFGAPTQISPVVDYPLTGTPFDAVDLFNRVPGMSARVDCYPHPASDPDPASSRVVVVWCDFTGGHGVVKESSSTDGVQWANPAVIASVAGNAFFPQASVSSNGTIAVTFDALTPPAGYNPAQVSTYWNDWQHQTYDNYYVESTATGFTSPLRVSAKSGNPDGSSYNNVMEQFLGDYIGIVAGPSNAYLVWTDSRNASPCAAVDSYRTAVYAGSKSAVAPNPDVACDTSFGNTDTYEATVSY